MNTVEIKLPEDFDDISAVQEYFYITDALAQRFVGFDGWVRVKEKIGMRMCLDPRFQGIKLRDSGDIMIASWWEEGH